MHVLIYDEFSHQQKIPHNFIFNWLVDIKLVGLMVNRSYHPLPVLDSFQNFLCSCNTARISNDLSELNQ